MATDSRKRPGRGFASTNRATAVSTFIKKNFGVKTLNSADRAGTEGVRVRQEPRSGKVNIRVVLDNEEQALKWAQEIKEALKSGGYTVIEWGSPTSFDVTKDSWQFTDMVARKMFGIDQKIMESDSELIKAKPYIVRMLRDNGWIAADTLELTEEGRAVRAYLLDCKRKRDNAEKRRLRLRGW